MSEFRRGIPPRKIYREMSAQELVDSYKPEIDVLQFCSNQVQDHIAERGDRQKGEMSGMELAQLKNMRSIFELVLPPEGSSIVACSDFHIDDIQHRRAEDEIVVPVSGLFIGEYLGINIEEYRYTNAHRYLGLVVRSCVTFQDGQRTFSTPVQRSNIYFYCNN